MRSPPALGPRGHEDLAKKEAAQAESEAVELCGAWFLVHLDIGSLPSSLWLLSQETVTLFLRGSEWFFDGKDGELEEVLASMFEPIAASA